MRTTSKTIAVLGLLALVFLPGLRAIAAEEPSGLEEAVRTFASEEMNASGVPGLVFVMVDADGVVMAEAFGLADVTTGREMTIDTPLRMGSISKPITAALGLELAAHGHLDLDVPVDTYLDVDLTDRYGPASTLRQLLQHRGGYPDAFVGSHHLEAEDALDLDEWVRNLTDRSIAPDVVASYSSVGYTLAGAAMAGALDTQFPEVAGSALFEPLGMSNATFQQSAPDDVAIGYAWGGGGFTPYPVDTPDLVPGAGLIATGNDIAWFLGALLAEGSPLSQSTRDGLLTPAGPYPGLRAYTTGLTEWRYEDRSALYHEGNGIGTSNRMTVLPDEGVGFYTAVNGESMVGTGDPSPQTLFMRDLHEMLVEEFYPGPSGLDAVPTADGSGQNIEARPAVYLSSRLDTGSVLRLEALVSQFSVDAAADGTVFYEGPDDVTYATRGGTGSYREAAWWETTSFNLALVGASLLVVITGSVVAFRRTRGTVRWLAIATGGLITAFIVSLGYGMTTVEVMQLFTGLPTPIRMAQIAIAGAIVSATALVVTMVTQRRDTTTRVSAASSAVILGTAALGIWAWAWQVLPI
jgi:CubicO group peptidase (beta-lactamase class C family)